MDIYGRLSNAYLQALNASNVKQTLARSSVKSAEQPAQEMANLFRAGGGYGAGQRAIIEEEGKKGFAAGLGDLTSTGMSSGTNVSGLRARIARDKTTAKLGVEDVRVGKLAEALGLLSQIRTTGAQTMASIETPSYGPYVGALSSAYGAKLSSATQRRGQFLDYVLGKKRIKSSENIVNKQLASQPIEKQHFNTPW